MDSTFYELSNFDSDLSHWIVDNVENFSHTFRNTLVNFDMSSWNVDNVKDMSRMFYGATAFDQDISMWNVGNCEDFYAMFYGATSFDSDLSNWDVSLTGLGEVGNENNEPEGFQNMFYGATRYVRFCSCCFSSRFGKCCRSSFLCF